MSRTCFSTIRLIKMTPHLLVLPQYLSQQGPERRVRAEVRTNMQWEELRNGRMERERKGQSAKDLEMTKRLKGEREVGNLLQIKISRNTVHVFPPAAPPSPAHITSNRCESDKR